MTVPITTSPAGETTATQTSPDRLQVDAMISEGGGVATQTPDPPGVPMSPSPAEEMSTAEPGGAWLFRRLRPKLQQLGHHYLLRLAQSKGRVSESLTEVVAEAHRRADQTRLALEMIDDFKDGTYRQASWPSVAALAGALLYRIQPHDVIPDFLPRIGLLDDDALLGLAIRLAQTDLVKYCRFKGYRVSEYFGA
jgi:uncharacterized membrane protein YkvA (DUF1232 family)